MKFSPNWLYALIFLAVLCPVGQISAEDMESEEEIADAPIAKVREEKPLFKKRKPYVRPKVTPVKLKRKTASEESKAPIAKVLEPSPSPKPQPITQDEPNKLSKGPGAEVREVLFTRDYVLLSEIDPIPDDVIAW